MLAGPGCWAHDVAHRAPAPGGAERPGLVPATRGRYEISRGDERIGEERFTITSSAGRWRAEGTIELSRPIPQVQRYVLELDGETREPISFVLEAELAGERLGAVGHRTDDDYFAIDSTTIAGKRSRRVPYGAGTALELGTPLSSTLVLSLLGPSLAPRRVVHVRTIAVGFPALEPYVALFAYELHAREGGVAKVAVSPAGAKRPIAMWVRGDGLPVRVRSWAEDGALWELRLVEGT